MVRVLFAAGGTGGHLFPALEIAEELAESGIDCSFAACGLSKSRFFPQGKWASWDLPAEKPSLRPTKALSFLFRTFTSTLAAYRLLGRVQPDCVLGFGSYHTVPVLLAAVFHRIPLYLFEPNASPGKVICLFSRFAVLTGICSEKTQGQLHSETEMVAMPLLRSSVTPVEREAALRRYGFSGTKPIVVAFGGSQGSAVINDKILDALHLFGRQERPELLLLCGQGQDEKILDHKAQTLGVKVSVVPFEKEMAYAYTVGDVFVARSGASTVAELVAYRKPAVCIPYPFSKDDHQLKNARELEREGLAIVLQEHELTSESLFGDVHRLLNRAHETFLPLKNEEKMKRKQFSKVLLERIGEKGASHG